MPTLAILNLSLRSFRITFLSIDEKVVSNPNQRCHSIVYSIYLGKELFLIRASTRGVITWIPTNSATKYAVSVTKHPSFVQTDQSRIFRTCYKLCKIQDNCQPKQSQGSNRFAGLHHHDVKAAMLTPEQQSINDGLYSACILSRASRRSFRVRFYPVWLRYDVSSEKAATLIE